MVVDFLSYLPCLLITPKGSYLRFQERNEEESPYREAQLSHEDWEDNVINKEVVKREGVWGPDGNRFKLYLHCKA